MALQDVKNDILREAREKADRIEEEGNEEARDILAEAEDRAEEIKQEAEASVEEEKEAERKKITSNARMEARQKKLEAKQEKIQEVFDKFAEKIQDLDEDQKKDFVQSAVEDAEFDVSLVQASEEYEGAVDQRKVDFEERDVDGFILVSEDGERSKNFSTEKIVDDFRDQYRKEVADKLFGEVDE
jgi:V/A-type H+-transporting ATPase subunit E